VALPYTLEPGIAAREGGHIYEGVSGTLRAEAGDNRMAVAYAALPIHDKATRFQGGGKGRKNDGSANALLVGKEGDPAHTVTTCDRHAVAYTLKIRSGCEGGGKGALVQEDKSATLATNNDQYLFQPVGLIDSIGGQAERGWAGEVSPTLKATHYKMAPCVAYPIENHPADSRVNIDESGKVQTEQANPICASDYKDPDIVAYGVDCRNLTETPELYPTLQAKPNGGQSLNFSHAARVQYIVRRLTPTECARLQGFADRHGDIDEKDSFTPEEFRFWHDVRNTHAAINGKKVQEYTEAQMLTWYNKLHADSAEYKMWGNGIALPPALYCMQGIVDAMGKEEDDAWLL
jgi:DNA (cytosine-5)-methyltransferase 1